MALAFQFNVPGDLDGTTPLPDGVPKTPDDEGVLIVQLPGTSAFGRFNPGELVTQKSAHYFLQSVQVTSSGGGSMSKMMMLGRAPGGGQVVVAEVDLRAGTPDGYYDDGLVVPAGYELAFENNGNAPFLVRVTMWALDDGAKVGTATLARQGRGGG